MKGLEIIAFYLPQYHPFRENDEWWGKGFTEWTNVGKAKPLFKGHNQPRIPTELGYYDLRLPIVREQQAQMAREAGVTAFCYWHYWFGNGKRLIPEVFDEVLESGNPDFPFCLGWANHSWFAKNWNANGTTIDKLLIEQTYPGIEDEMMHFNFLLKAFNDPRYVKIDGKPLLYIFDPISIPKEYIRNFKKWTVEAGLPGLHLVANITSPSVKKDVLISEGFDSVSYQRLGGLKNATLKKIGVNGSRLFALWRKVKSAINRRPPFMYDYADYYHELINEIDKEENVIPTLLPQWDHTPRSGWNGTFLVNATPEPFYHHCNDVLDIVKNKNNKIVFLKSWNEWGEGNMMEPDMTYGRGFIDSLRKAIEEYKCER